MQCFRTELGLSSKFDRSELKKSEPKVRFMFSKEINKKCFCGI